MLLGTFDQADYHAAEWSGGRLDAIDLKPSHSEHVNKFGSLHARVDKFS
jgi:ribonuclease BN (tRNA processing enzyme)